MEGESLLSINNSRHFSTVDTTAAESYTAFSKSLIKRSIAIGPQAFTGDRTEPNGRERGWAARGITGVSISRGGDTPLLHVLDRIPLLSVTAVPPGAAVSCQALKSTVTLTHLCRGRLAGGARGGGCGAFRFLDACCCCCCCCTGVVSSMGGSASHLATAGSSRGPFTLNPRDRRQTRAPFMSKQTCRE